MNLKSSKNWLIITAVLVLLLCSVASYVNRPLPAYMDIPSVEKEENTSELPELSVYEAEKLSFSYPSSWRQVTKRGNLTFLAPDGSYLMLQNSIYNPRINNATEVSVQQEVAASGALLLSFTPLNTSSFLLSYQNASVITWEYVIWDLETEYRLIFAYEDTNSYEELADYLFDTFRWEKALPIPETLSLIYSESGKFEFAVPIGWEVNASDTAYTFLNPQTGSQLCVSVSQTELSTLSGISQIQYKQEAGQSRPGLLLKNYGVSDEQLTAEAVYYSQAGEQALFYHIMYLQNHYLYEFLLDIPYSGGSNDYQSALECLKYFRCFSDCSD